MVRIQVAGISKCPVNIQGCDIVGGNRAVVGNPTGLEMVPKPEMVPFGQRRRRSRSRIVAVPR